MAGPIERSRFLAMTGLGERTKPRTPDGGWRPWGFGGRDRQVRRRERSQVVPAKPATLMTRSKTVEGSGTGVASVMTRIESPGSVTLLISVSMFPATM